MEYLFVYGTLLNHFNNEWSAYLYRNAEFITEGFFQGKLYDAGGYPAIVPAKSKKAKIYGHILRLNNRDKVLACIDDYEQVGEDYTMPNEYIRTETAISALNRKYTCWIYIYNWPVKGLKPIKEMSFPAYAKELFYMKEIA